jgi:hypothetical protein
MVIYADAAILAELCHRCRQPLEDVGVFLEVDFENPSTVPFEGRGLAFHYWLGPLEIQESIRPEGPDGICPDCKEEQLRSDFEGEYSPREVAALFRGHPGAEALGHRLGSWLTARRRRGDPPGGAND